MKKKPTMSVPSNFPKIIAIVLFMCICSINAEAQKDSTFVRSSWMDFGFGSTSADFFFYGHMDLNIEVKPSLLLTLAYEAPVEFNISGRRDIVQRRVNGLSLYAGKMHKTKKFVVSASVGLTYLAIHESNEDFQDRVDRRLKEIGIVGKAKVMLSSGSIGIGISPYFNLNGFANYAGVTVDIGIGNINRRWR